MAYTTTYDNITGLPRSVKSQEILHLVREIWNSAQNQGKVREIYIILDIMSTKSQEQQEEIENEESILNV